MKKKNKIITILIILGIVALSIIIMNKSNSNVSKETAQCIGGNSTLYTQLGCHACKNQEKMFGKNYQYLNIIDCWFEKDKCSEIMYTPTWIIKGEKYTGPQSIKKLKELTGC